MKSLHKILLPTACLALAACDDNLPRRDSITMNVGDAVASTIAAQTIDPWPRYSRNNNIPMDGAKAQRAIQKYKGLDGNGKPIAGADSGSSSSGYGASH